MNLGLKAKTFKGNTHDDFYMPVMQRQQEGFPG